MLKQNILKNITNLRIVVLVNITQIFTLYNIFQNRKLGVRFTKSLFFIQYKSHINDNYNVEIIITNKISDILSVNKLSAIFVRSESSRRAARPRSKVAPSK